MFQSLGEAPVEQPASEAFYDEWGFYPFERSLAANEEQTDQNISIDADSDFYWVGLVGYSTGDYEIRFRLPSGRYNASSRLRDALCVGTAQLPAPVIPWVHVPANGRLGVDIKDLSGAGNTVQIALRGFRRFRKR